MYNQVAPDETVRLGRGADYYSRWNKTVSDVVIFPQLPGEAYRRPTDFQKIDRLIPIVTSGFGTLLM
ncbi:MAG: hypothetical protein Q4C47_00270 [Planctomycetia bacterium]|nr:hypothetical protein [Planctomycetia bacterium]